MLLYLLVATISPSRYSNCFAQVTIVVKDNGYSAPNQWLYAPTQTPSSYSPEQLEHIVKLNLLSTKNNYFVKPDSILSVLKANHNFSRVLFYDEKGHRRMVTPANACEAPNLIETLEADLGKYPLSSRDSLALMLTKLVPYTQESWDATVPTVVLFWNRTLGLSKTDNVFDKARKIQDKFRGQINVLLVSTDAINIWPYPAQISYLAQLSKVAEKLREAQAFQE